MLAKILPWVSMAVLDIAAPIVIYDVATGAGPKIRSVRRFKAGRFWRSKSSGMITTATASRIIQPVRAPAK